MSGEWWVVSDGLWVMGFGLWVGVVLLRLRD